MKKLNIIRGKPVYKCNNCGRICTTAGIIISGKDCFCDEPDLEEITWEEADKKIVEDLGKVSRQTAIKISKMRPKIEAILRGDV